MKKISFHPKCVGIGEGGLDYFYGYSNSEMQKQSFLTQINVSRDTNLPLVIHFFMKSLKEDKFPRRKSKMSM